MKKDKSKKLQLNLKQSLALGRSLLSQGDLADADKVLSSVLAALPRQPDALHLMGALRNMQGKAQEALTLMEQSIALVGDDAARWNDIGLVYARLARDAEAIAAYQRSAELAGHNSLAAKALDNMARLQLTTDVSTAEASFRRALAIAPDFGLSWYGLAQSLLPQGRLDEALQASERGIALSPQSSARELVAKALVRGQHLGQAIAYYQQWQQQDPGNPMIEHHLKALMQPLTPERASDAYVESTFDHFASSFDNKLARLAYRAPELIRQALAALYPAPDATLDIADAGCGTGLCGPLVQPWAKRLCGFDLSGGMLEQAQARQVYTELHKAELVAFLKAHPREFDVLISADTLCYFGSLHEVMSAGALALRAGGCLLYTVEASDNDQQPHQLQPSGRYAHSLVHVSSAATTADLRVQSIQRETLRTESGKAVIGWLVVLLRP